MKRRDFLYAGTGAALVLRSQPSRLSRAHALWRDRVGGVAPSSPDGHTTLRDPRAKALALSAVEAARTAGARYADVRLTNTLVRSVFGTEQKGPEQSTDLGLSVRALVNGYWGWAATPALSIDEAVRVARLAVNFATMTAARGKPNAIELGTIPIVQNGEWSTPVKVDPFELDLLEIHEWVYGLGQHITDLAAARGAPRSNAWSADDAVKQPPVFGITLHKQERVLASTEGTFLTQTVIITQPNFNISYRGNANFTIPHFNVPVQAGWERIAETPVVDLFVKEMEKVDTSPLKTLPRKKVEIGQYDIVFGAEAMAQILSQTLGQATELDRVLGYEANATGGSYLGPDPFAHLGTAIASPLVTITADRSNPLGLATVKWDDEGVVPEDFPLITNGHLVNYQTTRAQAAWLAPWYEKQGQPVRSLACAMAPTALEEPMQHTPNLVLHPSEGTATAESMVQEIEHGLYIGTATNGAAGSALNLTMDWMCANGYSFTAGATEIRRGKPVATIGILGLLFNTTQLWKSVEALGGAASAAPAAGYPIASRKGDPVQQTLYSVSAVPARIKQVAVVDPWKRA